MNSPFDERKYKRLLKGLEAVEIKLNNLRKENAEFRIESEFYKKEYRVLKNKLLSKPHKELLFFLAQPVQTGHTPSMQNQKFYDGKIKFIKTDNLRDNYIKDDFNHYLSELGNREIQRTLLKENDIITTIIGATHDIIARSCIVRKELLPANINQNIALIRVDIKKIKAEFLNIYLNSHFGKKYLHYLSRQMEQVNLNCREVEKVIVPILSLAFQNKIEKIVEIAYSKREHSHSIYRKAEELLLKNIGLKDFKPSKKAINIKSFKKSFLTTGRLDAEYYQQKYENYLHLIKKYSGGFCLLQSVCNVKDSNYIPDEVKEYQYIELSDIGKTGNIVDCTNTQGKELPSRARRKINTNDVIISSIEGSLESCALVTKEYNNALCLTGFYVINSHKINSETLLVLFKSEVMHNILKQNCSGTILTAINKNEFSQIPIPLINKKTQAKIADLIQESFSLRRESDKLLEKAKEMVEKEIERS